MIGAGLPRQIERHQQLARGGGTMTDAVAPPSPTEAAQDADAPPPMARPPRGAALKGRDLIEALADTAWRAAASSGLSATGGHGWEEGAAEVLVLSSIK